MKSTASPSRLYTELKVFMTGFPLLYGCAIVVEIAGYALARQVDQETADLEVGAMFREPFFHLIVVHVVVVYWLAGWFFRLWYRQMPVCFWLLSVGLMVFGCCCFVRSYLPGHGHWTGGEPGFYSPQKSTNLIGMVSWSFGLYLTVTTAVFRHHFHRSGVALEVL